MDREACNGILEYMVPVIGDKIPEGFLNQDYFCEEVLPVCKNEFTKYSVADYEDAILETKPEHIQDN